MKRLAPLVMCVAAASTCDAAEALGRLFFTPAERTQLDVARMQKQKPAVKQEPVAEPPAPQIVTYGGVVRRSDGKAVLWINDRPSEAKEALAAISMSGQVRPDGTVTLQVPNGRTVDLKVGQSIELGSGNVANRRPSAAGVSPGEGKEPNSDPALGQKPADTTPIPDKAPAAPSPASSGGAARAKP